MAQRRLKFWGWGYDGDGPNDDAQQRLLAGMAQRFNLPLKLAPAPRLEELNLRAPRAKPPSAIEAFCSIDPYDRAAHHYGKSYRCHGSRRKRPIGPPNQGQPRRGPLG